jgi:hypothetical protein
MTSFLFIRKEPPTLALFLEVLMLRFNFADIHGSVTRFSLTVCTTSARVVYFPNNGLPPATTLFLLPQEARRRRVAKNIKNFILFIIC